jgi:hypothetical protein
VQREDLLVSPELRLASYVLKTDEVCWRRRHVMDAFQQLANKKIVILGFDIVTLEGQDEAVCIQGTSAYDMEECLRTRPWNECVTKSLEAAKSDVERTRDLTGYTGDFDDLWYCLTTMRWGEPIYPVDDEGYRPKQ